MFMDVMHILKHGKNSLEGCKKANDSSGCSIKCATFSHNSISIADNGTEVASVDTNVCIVLIKAIDISIDWMWRVVIYDRRIEVILDGVRMSSNIGIPCRKSSCDFTCNVNIMFNVKILRT